MFSRYLQGFEAAKDKEELVRQMFVALFSDIDSSSEIIEPYLKTIGEDNL